MGEHSGSGQWVGIAEHQRVLEENARLRERCASDPWWWAYSEYPDEGWCGPFETHEQVEASARDAVGEDDWGETEIVYRQARNPEGCAEIERLSGELATAQQKLVTVKNLCELTSDGIDAMDREEAQNNLRYASGIIVLSMMQSAELEKKLAVAKKDGERWFNRAHYLHQFVPPWATEVPDGLCPTMYGTGSAEGDRQVKMRIDEITTAIDAIMAEGNRDG